MWFDDYDRPLYDPDRDILESLSSPLYAVYNLAGHPRRIYVYARFKNSGDLAACRVFTQVSVGAKLRELRGESDAMSEVRRLLELTQTKHVSNSKYRLSALFAAADTEDDVVRTLPVYIVGDLDIDDVATVNEWKRDFIKPGRVFVDSVNWAPFLTTRKEAA